MSDTKCKTCDGCGRIASDEEGSPWSFWLGLPLGSALAVTSGMVTPLQCPECKGMGDTKYVGVARLLKAVGKYYDADKHMFGSGLCFLTPEEIIRIVEN